jgi:hypothetical protein
MGQLQWTCYCSAEVERTDIGQELAVCQALVEPFSHFPGLSGPHRATSRQRTLPGDVLQMRLCRKFDAFLRWGSAGRACGAVRRRAEPGDERGEGVPITPCHTIRLALRDR